MIHVGARPLQPACRWQMALFRNHTYTHTYIYTHTHTGIHTYINHAHGECPDVRNHTTDTCGYNITVCPASTWMSQTVNVLHVLCVLCTRICAWIYVYICISARKRSVLISISESGHRNRRAYLTWPTVSSIRKSTAAAHEKKETHHKRLLVSAPPHHSTPLVRNCLRKDWFRSFVPCRGNSNRALLQHARFVLTPVVNLLATVSRLRQSGGCGQIHAIQASTRMPGERADDGGPSGQRRKKARAADPSTSNTSGKASAEMLDHSAPKKRRTAEKLCEHQRRKSRCKDCGGSGLCEHQRRRSQCKDCGGGSFCEHQRLRSTCKDCGGSSICEHQRRRSQCKDCGGSGICEHQRVRSKCKDCGGSGICEHQRERSRCKDCREAKNKTAQTTKQTEREEEKDGGNGEWVGMRQEPGAPGE